MYLGVQHGSKIVDLGLNLGEDMDVCKCIGTLRHGGTINSCRAASPLVRLAEEEESTNKKCQQLLPPYLSGTSSIKSGQFFTGDILYGGTEIGGLFPVLMWCSKIYVASPPGSKTFWKDSTTGG
ncbi:hypothetical protein TNCV_3408621 [Trichonephila clavipes]|nr:hypothetical protein TNCV_3408621 [Trichonephila clavipes]